MPKVTEITVSAQETFAAPDTDFGSFKPSVILRARVDEQESFHNAVRYLQRQADQLLAEHKARIIERASAK